jgi:hypothetical protein
VGASEGVDRRERISDPGEIRKRRGVDREEFYSRRLAREADVGERDRVAVAMAAGGGVFQVRFERGQRGRVPMLAPFDAGRLIELEFVFQVGSAIGQRPMGLRQPQQGGERCLISLEHGRRRALHNPLANAPPTR